MCSFCCSGEWVWCCGRRVLWGEGKCPVSLLRVSILCPAWGLFLCPASQSAVWCRTAFPSIGPKIHSHLFLRRLPPAPSRLPQQSTRSPQPYSWSHSGCDCVPLEVDICWWYLAALPPPLRSQTPLISTHPRGFPHRICSFLLLWATCTYFWEFCCCLNFSANVTFFFSRKKTNKNVGRRHQWLEGQLGDPGKEFPFRHRLGAALPSPGPCSLLTQVTFSRGHSLPGSLFLLIQTLSEPVKWAGAWDSSAEVELAISWPSQKQNCCSHAVKWLVFCSLFLRTCLQI